MKKSKPILITLDPALYPFNKVTSKLSPVQKRQLKQSLKSSLQDLKAHFTMRGHGWDIDWNMVKDEIYGEVFGCELSTYLLATIMTKTNTTLDFDGTDAVLSKKKRRK